MSGVHLLSLPPCHGQKPAPRRGPRICVNAGGKRAGCAFFSFASEISSPETAAHFLSMARANERDPFGQLLLCHGQKISTPERPAHLPSYVRANERGLFAQFFSCPGQKSAPRRGPLICPHRQISGPFWGADFCPGHDKN